MPAVTVNTLNKKKDHVRKRRTGVITRAKYQKPTADNQRKQIMGNAMAIRALKKLMPAPIYTDWQYSSTLFASTPDASFSETIAQAQLMSPSLWAAVLRQDVNVTEASSTLVKRMQINLRYTLQFSNWAQYTTFIVSIRPDAVDRVINATGLVDGQDYIKSVGQDFNVRLNPAVFKVHYVRNVSLTKNTWLDNAAVVGQTAVAFNPETTMAKGQVNLDLNFNIKQPVRGTSWTAMDQSQFGPSQRLFLLTFIVQQADVVEPTNNAVARLDFDALYTCYNAS